MQKPVNQLVGQLVDIKPVKSPQIVDIKSIQPEPATQLEVLQPDIQTTQKTSNSQTPPDFE
jgi:hypothetical protein